MNQLLRMPVVALALAMFVGECLASDAGDTFEAQVRQADAAYWDAAFNHCNLTRMRALITDDIEFFHDSIGVTRGKENFVRLTEKNVCAVPNVKLRRAAVDGTVSVELLRDLQHDNKVYGAVVQGTHRFYVSENGAPEVLDDEARFIHVMLLENGSWKLGRAISYSHESAHATKK